jgi:hypothetical protein
MEQAANNNAAHGLATGRADVIIGCNKPIVHSAIAVAINRGG